MNNTWIKVTKDLDINEMDTPDDIGGSSIKYWIKCIDNGRKHKSMSGNSYELLYYEVYNRFLEPTELVEFNLKCKSLTDYFYGEYYLRANIEDNNNEIRTKNFQGCQIQISLAKLIEFMKKYGSFKSWEAIEIQEKYDDLQIQYKTLYNRSEELESELKRKADLQNK